MTTVQFNLPDAIARRARSEGLLTDDAFRELIEAALRRQAGRRLMQVAERLHAARIQPMSETEIAAEIAASRADRHHRRDDGSEPPHGTQ